MDNFIYFFVFYPKTKKENISEINFVIPENKEHKPDCIYYEETNDNKSFYYKKIFKVDRKAAKGKKADNCYFEFDIPNGKYLISFRSKGTTFVYDVNLEVSKKVLKNLFGVKRTINQNKIEYTEKLRCFEEALKKENEENKIDILYKETIDLFSEKNGFSLLIELFLQVYQKKDLCSHLLKKFREINKEKPIKNEKKYG